MFVPYVIDNQTHKMREVPASLLNPRPFDTLSAVEYRRVCSYALRPVHRTSSFDRIPRPSALPQRFHCPPSSSSNSTIDLLTRRITSVTWLSVTQSR